MRGADWAAIAEEVARALLGEPNRRLSRRDELRYGNKGSLSVRLDTGQWFDHENNEGGGVLDLVMRELGGGKAAALDWLVGRGLIEPRGSIAGRGRAQAPRERRPAPRRECGAPDPRTRAARAVWALARAADATPGRVYLARRAAWAPAGLGPDLPASVRWIEALPRLADAPRGYPGAVPEGAAGALVFRWRVPGEARPAAVSMLAVSEAGERLAWWGQVKTVLVGPRRGAVFVARPGCGAVHVCEGEVDALALALAPWVRGGQVICAGATAGVRHVAEVLPGWAAAVMVHADGNPAGYGAAERARQALERTGRRCRVQWYRLGTDPADALAEWIEERTAMKEAAGEACGDAVRAVWRDLVQPEGGGT